MSKKMYIAVLNDVPDYMVPTLVAHSVINAHIAFTPSDVYQDWLINSFKKVVLRVNQKEFDKIKARHFCWEGHENTTLGGEKSCLVVVPMEPWEVPPVLSFAKLWAPVQVEPKEKQDVE